MKTPWLIPCSQTLERLCNHLLARHNRTTASFHRRGKPRQSYRLEVERLEDRVVPDGGLAKTDTQLVAVPDPTVYGQPLLLTAVVTSRDSNTTPTGLVTFREGNTVLGSGPLAIINGVDQTTLSIASLAVGYHELKAEYSGDAYDKPSRSDALRQDVDKAETTTALSASPAKAHVGQLVTFTASVSAVSPGVGIPTGTVQFFDGANLLGTSTLYVNQETSIATLSTTQLGAGNHAITARYSGSTSFVRSQQQILFDPWYYTQISLVASYDTISVGQQVTFTATVINVDPSGPTPTGVVYFRYYDSLNNDFVLPTVALDSSGVARLTTTFNWSDSFIVFAAYAGGDEFDVSTIDIGLDVYAPATNVNVPSSCCGSDGLVDSGSPDNGNSTDEFSDYPVRYGDGVVQISSDDVGSSDFGLDWGQTRSWTNGPGYANASYNGNGWVDSQLPTLLSDHGGDTITVIINGTNALFFNYDSTAGTYTPDFSSQDTLTHDSSSDNFTLTETNGDQLVFDDFSTSLPAAQRGQFESVTDPNGQTTQVTSHTSDGKVAEVQRSGTSGSDTLTESYLYTYVASGASAGNLASVALQRKVDSGIWTTVQQVLYAYYNGTESYGNANDLKMATVEDGSSNVLNIDYYRYYTSSDSGGYTGAMMFDISGNSYNRLTAAFSDPTTATNAEVAPYADHFFQWDSSHRVTEEIAQGAGSSSASGGLGTYTYSYTLSNFDAGMNAWRVKTAVGGPDGNQEIVYTNGFGQPILTVQQNTTTDQQWLNYFEYDDNGRLILTAGPSAVSGYDDTLPDLVMDVDGNNYYLNNSAGLFMLYNYATTTTATSSAAGDVAGYLQSTQISQGYGATPITQESHQYIAHTAGGITIYPQASDTVYRNADGTGGETTSYSYTWFSSSNQVQSETITKPVISSSQNGPGTADTETTVFDNYERPVWKKDGDGFLSFTGYDPFTGAVVTSIADVDTSLTSEFYGLPSGWSTPTGGGQNLVTTYTVDPWGRTTSETSPNGNVSYTVHNDITEETRTYAGWNGSTQTTTGPISVTRNDRANGYTETLTMSTTPAVDGSGKPTGTESIAGIESLSRTYVNSAGQVIYTDDYFTLTGLNYCTAANIGTEGVNFYRTRFGYDSMGRQNYVKSPTGTITRTVYDNLGRVASTWIGTNDTGATDTDPTGGGASGNNMVEVSANQYDGGGVGDGNLTQTTQYPGGSAAARVEQDFYDWRDQLLAIKSGVQSSESTTVHRPITFYDLDNLGETTAVSQYDGDGVTITFTGGVPNKPSASLLRAYSTTAFDDQGRTYRQEIYSVDPSSGTISTYALTTNSYYNHRGDLIATSAPGGQWSKESFDGAARLIVTYTTDGAGGTSWAAAGSVSSDNVLEQQEDNYDGDGNVIETIDRQRFDNETNTGILGDPSTTPKARVYYSASYFDAADRQTASVNVGTNGGTAWTRPSSVPSRSDTVLVTSYGYAADEVQEVALTGSPTGGTFTLTYSGQATSGIAYNATAATVQSVLQGLSSIGSGNVLAAGPAGGPWQIRFTGSLAGIVAATLAASGSGLTGGTSPSVAIAITSQGGNTGRVQTTTDPRGINAKTDYDLLGRTVRQISAYASFVPGSSSDVTTEYTYDGSGHTLATKADLAGGAYQITQNVYGVTTADGSDINSNDILAAVQYPDPTTGNPSSSQQMAYTVNALGENKTMSDRDANVHTYTMDILGRVTADAVTTLGSGVDGTVRRIETAYNTQGLPYLKTSYDAASSGSIVNQVEDVYNGLGQLTGEYQAHSGAVNTSTTPEVQYAYTLMASGANNSRLTELIYPNGRILHYGYNSGVDDSISRLSFLAADNGSSGVGTHLEEYTYLGLNTVVKRAHPQTGVDLTYIKQSGEANGDAGDQYIGLDRFGRVVDQRWLVASTGVATDRFQYGYDRDGNTLYESNLVNSAESELFHANGASNSYDNLNQLTAYARGTLSDTNSDGIPDTVSSATDSQSWTLDALGNWSSVTTDGTTQTRTANAQNEITAISGATTPVYDANGNMTTDQSGHLLVYDAWNRLMDVKNGTTVLVSYAYDALNRRIVENPGTAVDLFFSQDWQVIEERVGGTPKIQYVWSAVYVDAMVERDRDADGNSSNGLEERLYVQQDANWNVTAVISTSGSVQERYVEDPYGTVTVLAPNWSAQSGTTFGWIYLHQGGRYDAVSGLYVFRNRDYSAVLGRWLEPDPAGFGGKDANLYRNVENNPELYVDPSGLIGIFFGGAGQRANGPGTMAFLRKHYDQAGKNGPGYFEETPGPIEGVFGVREGANVNGWANYLKGYLQDPAHRCEKVDIFGFSRGAVFGIGLAVALQGRGIPVRFLGLIDPVTTSVLDAPDPLTIPTNVSNVWLGVKDVTGVPGFILQMSVFGTAQVNNANVVTFPVESASQIVAEWALNPLDYDPLVRAHITMGSVNGKGLGVMEALKAAAAGAGVKWQ